MMYLTKRFFLLFGGVVILFAFSYSFAFLFPVAIVALGLAVALAIIDVVLLFQKNVRVEAKRRLPKILSLGDPNRITLEFTNYTRRALQATIIDELPIQFQKRDFEIRAVLSAGSEWSMTYELTPVTRGEYVFGVINVFVENSALGFLPMGLVQRRFRLGDSVSVPVYPSVVQMKQYELLAFNRTSTQAGLRKIRRIGHSYEFDQIKNYVQGDDYRSLNWKATGRLHRLMVNQYEDERSQQVYSIIDKSRAMKMPFGGLSLLDYAINTSLALSNIVLKKYDKAGLITFSDKLGSCIKADRQANQLNQILQALYNEQERPGEANFELLYHVARKLVAGRSLLMLYTNFESMFALDRDLPLLRRVNNLHLLVVLFFENTEIQDFVKQEVTSLEGIYTQTVAQQFLAEKTAMAHKLRQHGIQAVITRPEDLSMNTVNKYLELKARGMI